MKIKSVSKKSVILMEFDWVLFIATICLSVFGIVMIYSATRTLQSNTNVIVQSGAMVIGCAAMLVTCFFDYEQLKNLVKPIYIFAVAILLLVLVFGVSGDWGARSWIRFGAIGIQPVSYTHLRAHETDSYLVCRLLLEKKNQKQPHGEEKRKRNTETKGGHGK